MQITDETMLLQPESYQHMEQATGICRGCIISQLIQETTRWLDLGCGHISSSAYTHNILQVQVTSYTVVIAAAAAADDDDDDTDRSQYGSSSCLKLYRTPVQFHNSYTFFCLLYRIFLLPLLFCFYI